MGVRGLLAPALLVVCSGVGCASRTWDDAPAPEPPEKEEPLGIVVDSVEVVHGALRILATMSDGAADVAVRLGGACPHRDVGGGFSTPSTLVWMLGDTDLADALGCGLVVQAHASDGGQAVRKVAGLPVTFEVASAGDSPAEDAAELQSVSRVDLARCILREWPLYVQGTTFDVTVAVGGTALEAAPGSEAPFEAPAGESDDPENAPADDPEIVIVD